MEFENCCPECGNDAIFIESVENCVAEGYCRQARRCANQKCFEVWIDHVAYTEGTLIVGKILQRFRLRKKENANGQGH